jgi:hypothetical protein
MFYYDKELLLIGEEAGNTLFPEFYEKTVLSHVNSRSGSPYRVGTLFRLQLG